MYPQPQQYGLPPPQPYPNYASAYYHQPPPPPPPPVYNPDPVTFRRDYSNQLAELKVNSRPIIQNLSMIAQDFARYSDIVAQCIESHIRRVPQWMKLPAFYLLDAISKNVFDPYARNFAAFVVPLFLDTYAQVDEATRSKMEEMLMTWRTGSPSGNQLFGAPAQAAIERGVWGEAASSASVGRSPSRLSVVNRPVQTNAAYSGSGQITRSQVLSELEFTLNQKKQAVQANPYDTTAQNHINILSQLQKLVQAGVSQDELQQILAQLRSLIRPAAPAPAPPPPAPVAPPPAAWPVPQPSYPVQPVFPPAPAPPLYPLPTTYDTVKTETPPVLLSSTASASSAAQNSLLSLLSTLKKAGVVSENGTPQGAGTSSTEDVPKSEPPPPDLERESSRTYRDAILMHDVRLTSAEISRKRPEIVEFLYDRLAAQCKQCGIRFPDTIFGKKRMEDHLDMHFKQNRKANQNIGRGHSRSWFVGVEDWVHDVSVDVKGKGRADAVRPVNAKAAAAAELAKRDADLRAQFIVVPPGEEAKPVACPICKESFKSEWVEDVEDWVWRNAVLKDERVYHATCHAEATNGLAQRLRSEMASLRSHTSTPEAGATVRTVGTPPLSAAKSSLKISESESDTLRSVSLSPSSAESKQLVGTKRKVDDTDRAVSPEAEGTPRTKKLALAQDVTMAVDSLL
ncbi:CID domain-containing protein [Mycena sanguinolenta]|uniref:CID domain-containing protein n=1 Tax=Mycena sanguinolenta TaxID=230812 RepID=A0A8H6YAZ1_9AGAR|nr:CID domain-containing protein [Mycena sanguinolenta]